MTPNPFTPVFGKVPPYMAALLANRKGSRCPHGWPAEPLGLPEPTGSGGSSCPGRSALSARAPYGFTNANV